jgi:hypothetical protein
MNTAAAPDADHDAVPDATKPTCPRLRWFRFSLRTLLVVVTLAGCGLGWLGLKVREARRQQADVAVFLKLGGWIDYDYEYDPKNSIPRHYVPNATPPGPAWLRRVLGDDFFSSVYTVSFADLVLANPVTDGDLKHLRGFTKLKTLVLTGAHVTDAGVANLKGLTSLAALFLICTRVTDAGLEHLSGLTKLESLSLDGTHITDAGIVHLKGLTNLEDLSIRNTQITDVGLAQLAEMPHLRRLFLGGADVTAAGVAKFKKASPNCQIGDIPRWIQDIWKREGVSGM